jgi:monoamine oxidase
MGIAYLKRLAFSSYLLAAVCSWWQGRAIAETPQKTDVVIVGAGLSGLVTALELKKQGISYHILELLPRIGGRVRTVKYERPGATPVYADAGMEEFWESNPALKLLKEFNLPLLSDVAASSMVLDGRLEVYGADGQEGFYQRVFSSSERKSFDKLRSAIAPLIDQLHSGKISPELFALKDISFEDWASSKKLPKKVSDWLRLSLECEIGTSWGKISALEGIGELHIFVGEGEKSYRVIGGNEKFTEELAKRVGSENISLSKRVQRVVSKDGLNKVYYLGEKDSVNGLVEAKHVVMTIPLYRMLMEVQFEPKISAKKVEAINSMTWGSYFKAHVFVPQSAEKLWQRDGRSILPIISDSVLGVVYDGNPDQKSGMRIISLLVNGDAAERFNYMPLDAVRGEVLSAFEKIIPGLAKEVFDFEVYRYHPRAVASWPVGRSRYDELASELRKPEHDVYLAGDFTEGSHSDAAFNSAYRVSEQIKKSQKKLSTSKDVSKDGLIRNKSKNGRIQ